VADWAEWTAEIEAMPPIFYWVHAPTPLADAKAAFWKSAAQDIGADKNIPITAYVIGFQGDLQDPTGGWALDEILRL
jgi:hypothetical protein